MFSRLISGNVHGISVDMAFVEVDTCQGLPSFEMSGKLAREVAEARERVRVALKNSGYIIKPQRVTVNISPANTTKHGTGFDLTIALGILATNGIIDDAVLKDCLIMGELGLDGQVKPVRGILPAVIEAKRLKLRNCFVPDENADEGACVEGIDVWGVHNLRSIIDFVNGAETALRHVKPVCYKDVLNCSVNHDEEAEFSQIAGQQAALRASVTAAAGMHNILYIGAPGCGKTMMAKRIAGIMPELGFEDSLEVSKIYSIAQENCGPYGMVTRPPYRSPHHTCTINALIGGGRQAVPGEITLANKGILFLDELTEFNSRTLDALRQPLEDGTVTLSRCGYHYVFPARCMLVAAMNPCKCGYYPDKNRCSCSEADIERYQSRISKPLLDRFDMRIRMEAARFDELSSENSNVQYTTDKLKDKVLNARKKQYERNGGKLNSELTLCETEKICVLGTNEKHYMHKIFDRLNLTARGYHKILRVARTIADLDNSEKITCGHLGEAVIYRN